MKTIKKNCLCLLLILVFGNVILAQNIEDSRNYKQKIKRMSLIETTNLQVLFEVGDSIIDDLIQFLDDEDKEVRVNTQILIRYLGNEKGMSKIHLNFKERKNENILTLPVPTPLSEWDYEFINATILQENISWNEFSKAYLWALALDGSPRAKKILKLVAQNAEKNNITDSIFGDIEYLVEGRTYRYNSKTLTKDVLNNLQFIKGNYKAKIIGFNNAKNKVLLEVTNNFARYHIIILINDCCWKFSTINLVAVS